jgi:hypothetical protein
MGAIAVAVRNVMCGRDCIKEAIAHPRPGQARSRGLCRVVAAAFSWVIFLTDARADLTESILCGRASCAPSAKHQLVTALPTLIHDRYISLYVGWIDPLQPDRQLF